MGDWLTLEPVSIDVFQKGDVSSCYGIPMDGLPNSSLHFWYIEISDRVVLYDKSSPYRVGGVPPLIYRYPNPSDCVYQVAN